MNGRVGIITGVSSGIGQALALRLGSGGARLVINARRKEKLVAAEEAIRSQGGKVVSVVGDASEQSVIDEMFAVARERYNAAPDLVVVNAGRGLMGSLTTAKLDEFDEVVRTNLLGAVRLMSAAAKVMLQEVDTELPFSKARDIVTLGSVVGRNISPYSSVYGSTKFAVASLTEALRREVATKGIRVTLVEPGIVESGFQEVAGYDQSWRNTYAERSGPLLQPQDVARAIEFAISQPAHVHMSHFLLRPTRQDYP